jgi:alkanesulfonate monooxygenase SsuD/methylene tetrahydromethanopterin reductase-like flavin-dependent oxidoreductase (luciferase family)
VVATGVVEVPDLAATAKQAEGMGFSSIALNDHFNSAAASLLGAARNGRRLTPGGIA